MKKFLYLLIFSASIAACSKVSDPQPEPVVTPTTPSVPTSSYHLTLHADTVKGLSLK